MSRRRRGRRWRAVATAGIAGALLALVVAALAPRAPSRDEPAVLRGLPPPRTPAFRPGPATPWRRAPWASTWAPVRRPVVARVAADPDARPLGVVETQTPEGTDNPVAVLGRRVDGRRVWVRVRLAVLPAGTTGWVPRDALGGLQTVDTKLDIDLRALRATLRRRGRVVLRAPVGVGRPGWSTPRGAFLVRNRLTRYASPAYGPVAFGTSARSPQATDWPAGGFVGIHGTDRPDLIPGRVSHGCIRLRNADILALARQMPPGTPVVIR